MSERIDKKEFEKARRQLARNVAGAIAHAMAASDISYFDIAKRIGSHEVNVRIKIYALLDGKLIKLEDISDIFLAMGFEPRIQLIAKPKVETREELHA